MASLDIWIENPSKSYSPGENITGVISVVLAVDTSIKSIKLKCMGEMNFYWNEFIPCCQTCCQQRQLYLKEKIYLIGKGSTGQNNETVKTFESGRYTFPFSFKLPSVGLPSSFKSDHGSVEYYLSAVMKMGNFKYCNTKIREIHPFSVNGTLDLNSRGPILQRPTQIMESGYGINLPGGPSVGFSFTLSKTGFVPGEFLHFEAEIFNNSSQTIDFVAVRIQQEILFTGKEVYCRYLPQRYVYNDIMEYRGPQVNPLSTLRWIIQHNDSEENLKIKIGDIPHTRRRDRVQINYVVQMILETKNIGRLVGSIPILIGTIPFRTDLEDVNLSEPRKIYSLPFSGREALRSRQIRTCVAIGLFCTVIVVFVICLVVASMYINCC